jgi:hypothetical protein
VSSTLYLFYYEIYLILYEFLFCTFSTLLYSDIGSVDVANQCLESVQFGIPPCSFGRTGTLDDKKFESTNIKDILAQVMLEISPVQISVCKSSFAT